MFRDTPVDRLAQNLLVLGIQPDEGIGAANSTPRFPARRSRIGGVGMNFKYEDYFEAAPSHRLRNADLRLHDRRRRSFIRAPTASRPAGAWCSRSSTRGATRRRKGLATYRAGSEGPEEADELLRRDGRRWRPIA